MSDVAKYLLAQGVLGIVCLVEGWAIWRLWQDNRALTERLVSKSEKNAEVNQGLAASVVEALEQAARSRKRRDTKAHGP